MSCYLAGWEEKAHKAKNSLYYRQCRGQGQSINAALWHAHGVESLWMVPPAPGLQNFMGEPFLMMIG